MSDEPDSRFSVSERSASRREAGAQHEGPRQTSYLHVGLEGNVHVSASLCAASGSRLKKRQKLRLTRRSLLPAFALFLSLEVTTRWSWDVLLRNGWM